MSEPAFSHICIYEDSSYKDFFPITFSRPLFDLRFGSKTLLERILNAFPDCSFSCHLRPNLSIVSKILYPKIPMNHLSSLRSCLFINARTFMEPTLIKKILTLKQKRNQAIIQDGQLLCCLLQDQTIDQFWNLLKTIPSNKILCDNLKNDSILTSCEAYIIRSWNDVFDFQKKAIYLDQEHFQMGLFKGKTPHYLSSINDKAIAIKKDCFIEDFVTLDARKGPILIDENVYIQSHSRLEGPCYIGPNCILKGGLYSEVVAGPMCKLHGEISQSIFQEFTNKSHEGFIGNSYIGKWVNLGAGSTNSNLNLNYKNPSFEPNGTRIESQSPFFGTIIGDHVKTAIGTLINSGTLIGFGSQLLNKTLHQGTIKPFSWGNAPKYKKNNLDNFIITTQHSTQRRNIFIHPDELESYTNLHKSL